MDGAQAGDPRHNGISLVGNPNVGKSVLFGALSGRYAAVSNYPGTTVELTRGTLRVGGRRWPLVDTPGANSLVPQSEDERVTRDLLLSGPTTVLQVADAKNLVRGLALAIEIAEAGLPSVLCLNMADEAESLGVQIDTAELARRLGIDVVRTVATRREGIARLAPALAEARVATIAVDYGETTEAAIRGIAALLPPGPIAPRALAVAILGGDATLADWLARNLDPEALLKVRAIVAGAAAVNGGVLDRVQRRRLAAAEAIARAVSHGGGNSAGWARLGALTMHPFWGLPALALALGGLYLFVGVFGAQTAVGWFENVLFGRLVNPAVAALVARLPLPDLARDFIAGPYGLVTMGLTYAIAIVLPIVTTFFLAFSMLEDSGYLPRLAVMLNRVFRVMGLNGRAVLPMILGLGCDTMATLTTRILGTRRERLVVVLLLALGVPCSAQLGVILGMLAGLSWRATAVWAGVVAGVVVLVGWLAARVIPGARSDFILEIPPLRWPEPANVARKTLARIEWYLKEAVPLFLLGTACLFVADRTGLLGALERAVEPLVTRGLGLPAAASEAFIVGFLRRDFGAAGLYRLAQQGALDPVQVVVALVTMTLFIPCIANFFMIVKEQGAKAALAVAGFIIPFAVLVGVTLNAALRALGVTLT